MKINHSQRKKKSKALSSSFLETRSKPDKDTYLERRSLGASSLSCGNHADNIIK